MGQYYQTVIGTAQGWNKQVYYPLDFDEGLKLMEHSYGDTDFCRKIHSIIYKNPRRVIWIGDYANEKNDVYYAESNRLHESKPKSIPDYKFVWGSKAKHRSNDTTLAGADIDYWHSYLVNHSLKGYINLNKYYEASKINQWGVIDPLPILTVVGNGRGGGDYIGSNENRVGSWRWHLISIEDTPPNNYTKFKANNYSFVEVD